MNNFENFKNLRIKDLERLCKELQAEDLYDEVVAKINSFETDDELKEFGTTSYILEMKKDASYIFLKEKLKLENEVKIELSKLDLKSLRKLEDLYLKDEEVVASKNILREKIKNIRNVKTLQNLEDLKK